MFKRVVVILLGTVLFGGAAFAQTVCPGFSYTLANGTTANADQVMANFNTVRTCVNALASGGTLNNTTLSGTTTTGNLLVGITSLPTNAGGVVANVPSLWNNFSNNVAGIAPPTTGISLAWNYSGGAGENLIAFSKGPGSSGGLVFVDGSSGYNERARIDGSGDFLVGVTSGSTNVINKSGTQGATQLSILNSAAFFTSAGAAGSGAATSFTVASNTTTGRSINAGGTINASGADYAEYEPLMTGLTASDLHGGQIIGFAADGKVTASCKDAISFGVVSSNPSYVGGDSWGAEAAVGKFPAKPLRPQTPSAKAGSPEATPVAFDQAADFNPKDSDIAQFYRDAAAWTDKFKAAEQHVAIIAYAGKVPVDLKGAHPGDYIVPSCKDDAIAGSAVAANAVSFEQFRKAVGQVRAVLPDGRAQIAVGR